MIRFLRKTILLLAFMLACTMPEEPVFDNPLDPESPDYVGPETSITFGPNEGEVRKNDTVTFSWSGNKGVVEYSYRLTGPGSLWGNWSAWSTDKSKTFSLLNEGEFAFEVKGRYSSETVDESPAKRSFTIDDIQGPALWLYPRQQKVLPTQEFDLVLIAEDVVDLMALYAQVSFNTNVFTLQSYTVLSSTEGGLLYKNDGSIINLSDPVSQIGYMKFNLAVAGGDPVGVSGTGRVLKLRFKRNITSEQSISITAARMADTEMQTIIITEKVPAVIK